ncbi:MAG: ATP-binding protein [Chloroflexota bacterium]
MRDAQVDMFGPLTDGSSTGIIAKAAFRQRRWPAEAKVESRADRPVSSHPILGRDQDLASVRSLILEHRWVTLTGPAGVGKTSLASALLPQLAEMFPDGRWLVELAPLSNADLIADTVASSLDIAETAGTARLPGLVSVLRGRRALLTLDNCEHLASASAELIDQLLRGCPWLAIIATSRTALNSANEFTYSLSPLRLPSVETPRTPQTLLELPSVALFYRRAIESAPGFQLTLQNAADVAELCQQLDGLPLAIELAAARMKILSPAGVLQRLNEHFSAMLKDPERRVDRHQSLQGALDWSHELLSPAEAALLRRLAVFAGGWTYDAAEVVCVDDALMAPELLDAMSGLVDQSLIVVDRQNGDVRYHMLETVRQYARERLHSAGEQVPFQIRHLHWCAEQAAHAAQAMLGPRQVEWYDRLERELANARAALSFGEATTQCVPVALTLATLMSRFWIVRGHIAEARQWLERLLSRDQMPSPLRVQALCILGTLVHQQADYATARVIMDEAVPMAPMAPDTFTRSLLLTGLGELHRLEGDIAGAVALGEQGVELARAEQDPIALYHELYLFSNALDSAGRFQDAEAALDEALRLIRVQGDLWLGSMILHRLALIKLLQGKAAEAEPLMAESLEVRLALSDRVGVAHSLETSGWIAAQRGSTVRSAQLLGASEALREQAGSVLFTFERDGHQATVQTLQFLLGESIFQGEWAIGRQMTAEAAAGLATEQPRPSRRSAPGMIEGVDLTAALTAREMEVASLIARGMTNAHIAQALVLSVRTVERHIENIYTKLGARGKAGRAVIARHVLSSDGSVSG